MEDHWSLEKVIWFIGEISDGALVQKEHPHDVWVRFTYDPSEVPRKGSFYKVSHYSLFAVPFPIIIQTVSSSNQISKSKKTCIGIPPWIGKGYVH